MLARMAVVAMVMKIEDRPVVLSEGHQEVLAQVVGLDGGAHPLNTLDLQMAGGGEGEGGEC